MAISPGIRVLRPGQVAKELGQLETAIQRDQIRWVSAAAVILQKHVRYHTTGKTIGGLRLNQSNIMAGAVRKPRGNLARSFQVGVGATATGATATLGSSHPAAAIHETGDTVRPKRSRYLAIPVHPLADRKTPADFPDAVVVNAPRGPMIVLNRNRRSDILFLLRRSVFIPGRRYLTRAMNDASPEIGQATAGNVTVTIRRAQ